METLSRSAYETLTRDAQCLTHDTLEGRISPKVLLLSDRSILKLFRLKHLVSSARLRPYAIRFRGNAARLKAFGIPTVDVRCVYRIPEIKRTAVHYQPLEGITLRAHGAAAPFDAAAARRLGLFLHRLHAQGIYFRSIHFGNIVITREEHLGLIDVADMRFQAGPLGIRRRIRNLRHFFRYPADADLLAPVRDVFLETYCRQAALGRRGETRFRRRFQGYFQS